MEESRQRVEEVHQRLVAAATSDAATTASLCALWRRLSAALSPIIGVAGVRALLRRSILLNGSRHPWLASVEDQPADADAVEALCGAITARRATEILPGSIDVLTIFHALLVGLIGEALTERFLQAALAPPQAGEAVQDPAP